MQRQIELMDAVDVYFRALHTCDAGMLDAVFHPASSLFDADEGCVAVDPYPVWRENVANRPSPASAGQARAEEVLNVDWLSPAAAVVRVRLRVLDSIFVDQLSFVDGVDGWQIVAKVWHLESSVTAAARTNLADELEGESDLTSMADAVIARAGQPSDDGLFLRESERTKREGAQG